MDVRQYYSDRRKIAVDLVKQFPDGIVYITSIFNRERNTTEGATCSVGIDNATRCLVEGTHRLATEEEIDRFNQLQETNRVEAAKGEQRKRQQYVVVVNEGDPSLNPLTASAKHGTGTPIEVGGKKSK